jgi:hypothetical protein
MNKQAGQGYNILNVSKMFRKGVALYLAGMCLYRIYSFAINKSINKTAKKFAIDFIKDITININKRETYQNPLFGIFERIQKAVYSANVFVFL